MTKKLIYAMMAAFAVFAAVSCGKEKPVETEDPELPAKSYLRSEYMDTYYYWNEQVNERNASLDPKKYTIEQFFDAMLYAKDRWSWMSTGEEYAQSETGQKVGTWGVVMSQPSGYYDDYTIHVAYIFPGSPFEKFGVTRGAALIAIGGQDIEDRKGSRFDSKKLEIYQTQYGMNSNTFTFRLVDGRDTTFTAERATSLSTRSYLAIKVFKPGDFPGLTEPVGYFNYRSFLYNFLDDIDNAMATFAQAGCKKLIIDLRYNGGGDSRASSLLASYLAPTEAVGKILQKMIHNKELSSQDKTVLFDKNDKHFNIDEIYFITGYGSASASEVVINGLKPFLGDKIHLVGQQTYGKPNGMYVLLYPGSNMDYQRFSDGDYSTLKYVFLPICFYNCNSLGDFIPDDGFVPNNEQSDDLYHDFGVEERCIKSCLTHIVSGVFLEEQHPIKSKSGVSAGALIDDPVRTDPHYGTFKVLLPR